MAGTPPYWTKERLTDLRNILDELSTPVEGSVQKIIELEGNLAFAVWKMDVKKHPEVALSSVSWAVALLVDMGIVDKQGKRGGGWKSSRRFNPDKDLTDDNIRTARAARSSQRKKKK